MRAYSNAITEAIGFILHPSNRERLIEIMGDSLSLEAELAGQLLDTNSKYFTNHGGELSLDQLANAAEWTQGIGKTGDTVYTVDEFTIDIG